MSCLPTAVSSARPWPADGCTGAAAGSLSSAEIQAMLRDPATSFWLRRAYAELQARDPLDALHDAALLYRAMCARCDALPL